ncbi:branched-chain amino acid ABC transporter permease [Leifsonia bigeumensis]|uniref:Branched-chain amino acid ABC transporter permease n=1 Tax=Leifsonella bigeumensis TaxID=433643 RepID=A0ABP7F8Z2_9MICO
MIEFFYGYSGQLLLTFAILAIAASGWSVIFGTGMFSMAPSATMGIGAYGAAVAYTHWGIPFPIATVIGVVLAAVVSALLSLFAWRLDHLFLGIATLGVAEFLVALAHKTPYVGGSLGMPAGFDATPPVVLITLVIVVFALWLLRRTRLFSAMRAVGDDTLAAQSVGIDTRKMKVIASIVGGVILGVSGALYTFQLGSIIPSNFGFSMIVQIILAVLIGGRDSLFGPVVGAAVVIALPELARLVSVDHSIAYGLALMLIVLLRPQGLIPGGRPRWLRAKSVRAVQAGITS